MRLRKIILSVLLIMFTTPVAFCQSEVLKGVVNSLAHYQENKEVKFLISAKKSIDSLLSVSNDSTNFEKNLYLVIINSSILYVDSLNQLNQPPNFLDNTTRLWDRLSKNAKRNAFAKDLSYAGACLADVHIRNGFNHLVKSDIINAQNQFLRANKFAPSFKHIDAYLAYANVRLGNLPAAASFYDNLPESDQIWEDHVEAASTVYKAVGDTLKALKILERSRKTTSDNFLLLDEANIYNNKRDYASLETLLPALLENNANNADIVFVAANCYDRLGEYNQAEPLYIKASELNGSAFEPAFNLGLLYLKKSTWANDGSEGKNITNAAKWLEKANEILPNNVHCLEVLSMLYEQTGNKFQLDKISSKLKQLTN
jgi:tetratricopeptide (TPR) repeat protein